MAFRPATGRKIEVEKNPKSVRAVMRRHLREEGKLIIDLCDPWNMHKNSVYRRFYDKRAYPPQYIEAFIQFLKLDDFDATELRVLGAIEAGWDLRKQLGRLLK